MRATRRAFLSVVVFQALSLSIPRSAQACGGGIVSPTSTRVASDTQRILLSVRGDKTDVITQIVVPETTADYGVLLPVPSEPTLDPEPVSSEELDRVDEATAPQVFVETEDESRGCGCLFTGSDAKAGGDGRGGVRVSDAVDIGPVTAVVLTGDTGDEINTWLTENGFALPAEGQALVSEYSGTGRFFIAIRRNETAAPGGPTSIGLHFSLTGDQRSLPLRFARLGAAETVAFTIFVAAPEASAPAAPFEALTLSDLDAATLQNAGYAAAVSELVAARSDRAFVIEGIHAAQDVIGVGTQVDELLDPDQKITRLTTIVPASALDVDVSLDETFTGEAPSTRHASLSTSLGGRGFSLGASFAIAGALFGRRRRAPSPG